MNYLKIYNNLIHSATNSPRPVNAERHHIIPKSLGGSNDSSNLVYLSMRAHYVAHRLLVKIYRTHPDRQSYKKMVYALWFMSKTQTSHRRVTSHSYSIARIEYMANHPQKDHERKLKTKINRDAGKYKYDYEKVSNTLSATLLSMTPSDMEIRMTPAWSCDQAVRSRNIRIGKASTLLLIKTDGTEQLFMSYDDVVAITGYIYNHIKYAILHKDGRLSNGSSVKYIHKYEGYKHTSCQQNDK